MGVAISIANQSDVPVNVALKQVGVLYWKNHLAPGESVTFELGRVWVTVEAIVDNEKDERTRYKEIDRVLPIALAAGGALAVAGGAALAIGPAIISSAGAAAAVGGTTLAAKAGGAAAAAAGTEAILGAGTASPTGAAASAAAGAFAHEVAATFGRRAIGAAADIVVSSTVGELYRQYRREPELVKAKKYGVYAGNNPKLVVKGNSKSLTIEYLNVDKKSV